MVEPDLSCSKHRHPTFGCETCRAIGMEHRSRQQRDDLLAAIEDHRTQQNGAPRGNVTAADRNLYRAAERVRKGKSDG